MTTDKPKWWQNLVVYGLVALLLAVGPYVGGYLLLGKHSTGYLTFAGGEPDYSTPCHSRLFNSDALREVFSPLGWAEAKIRGKTIIVSGPDHSDRYEPGW